MSLTVHLALVFHVFIVVAIMVIVCGRHGLWPSWFAAVMVMVCACHGLCLSWFVAVMVCGRHGHGLWPSWFVAVMVCGCHGLWSSWLWPSFWTPLWHGEMELAGMKTVYMCVSVCPRYISVHTLATDPTGAALTCAANHLRRVTRWRVIVGYIPGKNPTNVQLTGVGRRSRRPVTSRNIYALTQVCVLIQLSIVTYLLRFHLACCCYICCRCFLYFLCTNNPVSSGNWTPDPAGYW